MFEIVRLMDRQQSINKKIANQNSGYCTEKCAGTVQKAKTKRSFLGIFGKKSTQQYQPLSFIRCCCGISSMFL